MSQQILQTTDFASGNVVHNVQGVLYRGEGSPLGQKTSTQLGAIYIDITSGNLWLANSISSNTGWQPFYSQITTGITVSSDVQEGDLIGIYGAGTWAASGNLTASKTGLSGFGSSSAGVMAGGINVTPLFSVSELFNGVTWTASGNMSQSKFSTGSAGSQNAGLIGGGFTTALTSVSETFNGTAWSTTGNLTQSKYLVTGAGSLNAGLMLGGNNAASVSTSELFNGATWVAGSGLTQTKQDVTAFGSQNAAAVSGGTTSGSVNFSTSELFNGSTWNTAAVISQTKSGAGGDGSQNSGLMAGGSNSVGSSVTELFNGTTWSLSGALPQTVFEGASSGSQKGAFVAGGISGATVLNISQIHSQSTYRRLNYPNLPSATNIGMAYNVSSTTSSASLCRGDIPNTRIASQNMFGFSKHTQESSIVLEATRNITSITASGQTAIITTSSNTNICNGMLLQISNASNTNNNGLFPVISFSGGTQITVKNPNAVTQASATGTVQLIYGNRLSGLTTTSITVTGGSAVLTFSSAGGLSASNFQRLVKVGGNIYIPYSATSGSAGSSINWGTYRITAVGSLTVTVTTLNAAAATEASIACTAVEYFAQCFTEKVVPTGSFIMGFNNRLGLVQKAMNDGVINY